VNFLKSIGKLFDHPAWILFTVAYIFLLSFSFFSMLTVVDEYEGGSPVAEFGGAVFNYFGFPVFTLWSWLGMGMSSHQEWLIWVLVFVNLAINYLFTLAALRWIIKRIKRSFRKSKPVV